MPTTLASLRRGYRRGNAGISTNHTLAIVNCGGATAQEVIDLAREIRDRVRDRFGYGALVTGRSLDLLGKLRHDPHGFVLRTPSLTK